MTTLERPHEERTRHLEARGSPTGKRIGIAIAIALALVVGGLVGYLVRGDGDDSAAEVPAIVVAGEEQLTPRHEQMVEMVRDSAQAWRAQDIEALEAMHTPDATVEVRGVSTRVADGSLADYVRSLSWNSLAMFEPMLVHDHRVLAFHTLGGTIYADLFVFTESGPLLMTHAEIAFHS